MSENEWKKVIAEMKLNQVVEVYSIFHANIEERDADYFPFNTEITSSIQNNNAVAAMDVSVKGDNMSGAWILSDINQNFELSNKIYHKRWRDNTAGSAEVKHKNKYKL